MGCVGTRTELNNEERALIEVERDLKFYLSTSRFIDVILRKYSNQGLLNQSQFEEVVNALGLEFEDGMHHFDAFFAQYQRDSTYVLNDLIILGVLLGRGELHEKAELLFQVLDVENTKQLSAEQVLELLNKVLDTSLTHLSVLINEDLNRFVRKGDIMLYTDKLKAAKPSILAFLMEKLPRGPVTQRQFVDALTTEETRFVLEPFGTRLFARKLVHQVLDTGTNKIS